MKIAEYDECPVCQKKPKDVIKEYGGLLLSINHAVICIRCGAHYTPKSQIKHEIENMKNPKLIVDPSQDTPKIEVPQLVVK